MAEATLLVELLTEELPPKSLPQLGRTFAELLAADLAGGMIGVGLFCLFNLSG